MGFDVYGRQPSSEEGKYFRASIWSWRPIHLLLINLCSDILDQETLGALGFNDGAGPEEQEICDQIANRLEHWMEHNTEGHSIESDELRVTKDGYLLSKEQLAKNPQPTTTLYNTTDEHLKEWIQFLRNCGGFQVY